MKLIVFDIDGTLTNTTSIEDQCFYSAFEEAFGIDISHVEWHTLPHVTDLGITTHLLREAWGREAEPTEIQVFQDLFLEKLTAAKREFPAEFSEVAGASSFFKSLEQRQDVQLAIATGAWSGSARIKLGGIGIDPDQFPFGNSDNFISRTAITNHAIQLAQERTSIEFERIVYFGDGIWDFKTCRSMNIPFVGIDCKKNGKLTAAGAECVFTSFLDPKSILHHLVQI